jgi:hypothetical protein
VLVRQARVAGGVSSNMRMLRGDYPGKAARLSSAPLPSLPFPSLPFPLRFHFNFQLPRQQKRPGRHIHRPGRWCVGV